MGEGNEEVQASSTQPEVTGEAAAEVMPQAASPETPTDGNWKTIIVLQRHSAYDSGRPADWNHPTTEEAKTLGRLTEDTVDEEGSLKKGGKTLATERARERLEAILATDPENIDFLIVSSPTFWVDKPEFGQRARETADIITEEIKEQLKEKGLSERQILNTQPVPIEAKKRNTRFRSEKRAEGSTTKLATNLRETQMFQTEYAAFLRARYGGQGPAFWKAYNADAGEDREKRLELGAPGPMDDARDINTVVNSEARYARLWHQNSANKGRKLVIWDVTHGDGLEPYLQRVVGVGPEEFSAGYNSGVSIVLKGGEEKPTVVIAGKTRDVPIAAHGNKLPPLKDITDSQNGGSR